MFKYIFCLLFVNFLSVKSAAVIPTASTRITDGDVVQKGQFLFDVSIRTLQIVEGDIAFAVHICSGVLLNEYWTLTAASCTTTIKLKNIWILLGYQVRHSETVAPYDIERLIFHPRFRNRNPGRDNIALIKSAERIKFNEQIKPIALSGAEVNENVNAQVSGRVSVTHDVKQTF